VVGPSASGKTTLAKLLLGIYAPTDGVVRLDGANVWQWAHVGMGRHVGYLPQSVGLFRGSVGENIARLRDVRDCAGEVIQAAKRAHAHEMILKLPKGYDTAVVEDGGNLSGGQRQLIGLARALFGSPRFVVLDEPNAYLDGESEVMLRQLIRNLKRDGVTLVMVGHRPSLMSDLDKLLVLKEGRQVLFGPRVEIIDMISAQSVAEPAMVPAKTADLGHPR
jgi:ABC-type protease/lipase transport system fused ATPase/permease subunit